MMKRYVANSHVSVNISLADGGNMYVSFAPLSGGGSAYMTDDEGVQKGLEGHYQFGNLFFEDEIFECSERSEVSEDSEDLEGAEEPRVVAVRVSDLGEAKDYLAEHYGVVRSSVRSVKSAVESAKRFGLVFEGLEE